MGAISVEESSTVGTEFLDYFLRGDGALGNHLLRDRLCRGLTVSARDLRSERLNQIDCGVRPKILNHTLRDQNQRTDQANWEQNPEETTRRIDPEVPEFIRLLSRDAADDNDGENNADGGGCKIM